MIPVNVDVAARPKDYFHLRRDELLVTSMFYTIQGEGPYAGEPATFIRLAGCNFGGKGVTAPGCSFCDTKFHFADGQAKPFDEIYDFIAKRPFKNGLVVITGGEPLLQDNIMPFINNAEYDLRIQIESNGSRFLPIPSRATLVVSPKIPEPSKVKKYPKLSAEMLDQLDVLKVIVSADPSSPYHNLPDYIDYLKRREVAVYVSPMAVYREAPNGDHPASMWDVSLIDPHQTAANHAYAAQLTMKHDLRLSVQMHLLCNLP